MDDHLQTDIRRRHSDSAGERGVDEPHRMYVIEEVTYEDGYGRIADREAGPEGAAEAPVDSHEGIDPRERRRDDRSKTGAKHGGAWPQTDGV